MASQVLKLKKKKKKKESSIESFHPVRSISILPLLHPFRDNPCPLLSFLHALEEKFFPHSPRGATSIELRKAITDNGPNGTRSLPSRAQKSEGRKTKDKNWREREKEEEIRMYRMVIKRLRFLSLRLARVLPPPPPPPVTGNRSVRSSFWTLNRFACGNFPGLIFAALLAPSLTSLTSVYPPPQSSLSFPSRFDEPA